MDSRPQLEGRALLQRLLGHGVACSYVLLNAASYIMQEVTKVSCACWAAHLVPSCSQLELHHMSGHKTLGIECNPLQQH